MTARQMSSRRKKSLSSRQTYDPLRSDHQQQHQQQHQRGGLHRPRLPCVPGAQKNSSPQQGTAQWRQEKDEKRLLRGVVFVFLGASRSQMTAWPEWKTQRHLNRKPLQHIEQQEKNGNFKVTAVSEQSHVWSVLHYTGLKWWQIGKAFAGASAGTPAYVS
ncbi:unnamed protein product [Boreogadus saida]